MSHLYTCMFCGCITYPIYHKNLPTNEICSSSRSDYSSFLTHLKTCFYDTCIAWYPFQSVLCWCVYVHEDIKVIKFNLLLTCTCTLWCSQIGLNFHFYRYLYIQAFLICCIHFTGIYLVNQLFTFIFS